MARLPAELTTTRLARNVSVGVLVIVMTAVVAAVIVISANVRYQVELEPPAQYKHPFDGSVDERVMPVAEVRKLCTSLGASRRSL
jgi:hypothetical protein